MCVCVLLVCVCCVCVWMRRKAHDVFEFIIEEKKTFRIRSTRSDTAWRTVRTKIQAKISLITMQQRKFAFLSVHLVRAYGRTVYVFLSFSHLFNLCSLWIVWSRSLIALKILLDIQNVQHSLPDGLQMVYMPNDSILFTGRSNVIWSFVFEWPWLFE